MKVVKKFVGAVIFGGSLLLSAVVAQASALSATLSWDPVTEVEAGVPLTNLQGYKIYYGTQPGQYTKTVTITGSNTTTILTGFEKGVTYYFVIRAFTACLCESEASSELVWRAPSLLDSDHDMLDDDWEVGNFQTINVTSGSASDADHDGASDLDEFIAGTDPDDASSVSEMTASIQNGRLVITFPTRAATGAGYENRQRFYTLEKCVDLRQGVWQSVDGCRDILAAGQDVQYTADSSEITTCYKTSIRLN